MFYSTTSQNIGNFIRVFVCHLTMGVSCSRVTTKLSTVDKVKYLLSHNILYLLCFVLRGRKWRCAINIPDKSTVQPILLLCRPEMLQDEYFTSRTRLRQSCLTVDRSNENTFSYLWCSLGGSHSGTHAAALRVFLLLSGPVPAKTRESSLNLVGLACWAFGWGACRSWH